MPDGLLRNVLASSQNLKKALFVDVAVFDFAVRDFVKDAECSFCSRCGMNARGECKSRTAHTYGSFEAERWNGLYVYYCPVGLVFVSAIVFEARRAAYAIVIGPVVMGRIEDMANLDDEMIRGVKALARRSPKNVSAFSQIQWHTAMYLSGRGLIRAQTELDEQANLHNTLYEITGQMRSNGFRYPFEVERRLQKMIIKGDKQGARELINQLLGAVYFSATGDFGAIKAHAKELIVLFSRASIDGGADTDRIFGKFRDVQDEIDRAATLDELSQLLTQVFYRFVGYVFDFSKFEHADIIQKAVGYLRENLSERVTLEGVAYHVGLSRGYLSTIFKAELGQTFTDFVNKMRVEKGKDLLLNPELSLAAIADLVGYNDQSYFTKMFAKQVGMSPGQYRKKRGQMAEGEGVQLGM